MSSLLFYSENCSLSNNLIKTIKTKKLEKYFTTKKIEELEIEEIVNSGIEIVPTIINEGFYYEKEECVDFIESLTQYLIYSQNANIIIKSKVTSLSDDKCGICMGEFEQDESVDIFYCEHKFHSECSQSWRKTKNSCPMCNKSLSKKTVF